MDRETIIYGIPNDLLIKEFFEFFNEDYGKIKVYNIIDKVNKSKVVRDFIIMTGQINIRPSAKDFLGCIHSSRSFIFSKAETISIATIILLKKWNHEVGIPNQLSDDTYLNETFFSILDGCQGFKINSSSRDSFFKRFENFIVDRFIILLVESNKPVLKDSISFDSVLCDAISTNAKTEFSLPLNLEIINSMPNDWDLHKIDLNSGGYFSYKSSKEPILISSPYKVNDVIDVYNFEDSRKHCKIKITSFIGKRLKDVYPDDAVAEGFGAYKDLIYEMREEDPSINAEYCLFIENWLMDYGGSLEKNEWLWTFKFQLIPESTPLDWGSTEDILKLLNI